MSGAAPTLTEAIPEDRRQQAQREIVDLIGELHKAAQSLGRKLVGLQAADLKTQRRYLGAFHKFYSAGFQGSAELMEIEARLRGVTFSDLSDEYHCRAVAGARRGVEWRRRCAETRAAVQAEIEAGTMPPSFTPEMATAILEDMAREKAGFRVIDGGLS